MPLTPQTLSILLAQRHVIDSIQDDQTRQLARRWAQAWDAAESQLRTATLELAELGDDAGVTPVVMQVKARQALAIATSHLEAVISSSSQQAAGVARELIDRAASDQTALISAGLPTGWHVPLLTADPDQIAAVVRRTLDHITVRHYYLNAAATEAMKRALVTSTALGRSPREAADRMVKSVRGQFEGGLTRALVIARTEQLDGYRAASAAHQEANRDVLAGWVWCAELNLRTCPSCIAQHGSEHPLDEDGPLDHHQGRCTRLPVTKSWAELGIDGIDEPDDAIRPGDGVRWLERQSDEMQERILGPKRYAAWQEGRYPPSDWSVRVQHWSRDEHGRPRQDWRDSFHVGPVRDRTT